MQSPVWSITSGAPAQGALSLRMVVVDEYDAWLDAQPQTIQNWLAALKFESKAGKHALIPDAASGKAAFVLAVVDKAGKRNLWSLAHLPAALPAGEYVLGDDIAGDEAQQLALGWQLATYQFDRRQKQKEKSWPVLVLPQGVALDGVKQQVEAITLVRDLINRPANDLTPFALADSAEALAKKHKADITIIRGDDLLKENYPLVHAVGRASSNTPCLVDLRWGKKDAPKVTLVGKGVCFDSGGLDIKPSSGMKLMKKDMGGAAHVLGLAHLIMSAGLPIQLRVLVPAVENSVSANAFRPMDIITSRKGLTVEIGNTDAEGRLILCDALAEADTETPELLIDFATLTGAARVALGTDLPAYFTADDELAAEMDKATKAEHDGLWRLPLWEGYRDQIKGDAADLNSAPDGGYAGAITAALYLSEFVENTTSWMHIDLMAWNLRSRPGRPAGGEAMGLRAVYRLLEARYRS